VTDVCGVSSREREALLVKTSLAVIFMQGCIFLFNSFTQIAYFVRSSSQHCFSAKSRFREGLAAPGALSSN